MKEYSLKSNCHMLQVGNGEIIKKFPSCYSRVLYLFGQNEMGANTTKTFCDKKGMCLAPD